MQQYFEAEILAHPDDPFLWSAYADWLDEQGNPSGEVLRIRQALLHSSLQMSSEERLELEQRMQLMLNDEVIPVAPVVLNSVNMKLALISPSKYGSQWKIERPYLLGVYPVTQDEFLQVTRKNPSSFSTTGANAERVMGMDTRKFPVENTLWGDDAKWFCERLSRHPQEVAAGRIYRIPTEGEWEYACRAGTNSNFHVGDELTLNDANILKPSTEKPASTEITSQNALKQTCEVGSYLPNAFGLYDMHGNVCEWCESSDPESNERILRGGCWIFPAESCTSSSREFFQFLDGPCVGFRVLCELAIWK